MRLTAILGLLCTCSVVATAQITPEQDALVVRVLREVAGMDEELKSIQENQQALDKSDELRRDEYRSLTTRYPGITLSPSSSAIEMYNSLHDYRMRRALTVKPLVDEQARDANAKMCVTLNKIQIDRKKLEDLESYKNADLKTRMELRKIFDEAIAEVTTEGDPCSFSPN